MTQEGFIRDIPVYGYTRHGDEMSLLRRDEPVELKNDIQELIGRMKEETWDYQSLGVWAANKVPQYLWTKLDWKSALKKEGWTWQKFLKMISYHTNDLIRWVSNETSWDELVDLFLSDISNPTLKRMYFFG